jgi:hypothetical protein
MLFDLASRARQDRRGSGPPVLWCLAMSQSSMFSIVLDDGHEHVWERIGQVTDVIVLEHCTVPDCGAGHYYDPNAQAPFTSRFGKPVSIQPT